ncbi:DUF7260 family protein [Halovenus salina]|uniref:DUF7260 domain-containing protein n=1 Tax=Halovenus salina TaxID=1510225 RepID=A0ABD5W2X2_9EURY
MSLETHLDSARERVRSERDAVQKKQTAYKRFITRVKNLSPGSIQSGSQVTALASGGTQLLDQSVQTETDCAAVRTAFRETIRPHSVDDLDDEEPLLQTIRAELSESLAIAVAPTTETRLTVDLQEAIVTEAQSQRVDLQAMEAALNRERDQLATAADTLTPIIEWLIDVNETPLLDVGFEGLADRHSTLESHRDSCEQLLLTGKPSSKKPRVKPHMLGLCTAH